MTKSFPRAKNNNHIVEALEYAGSGKLLADTLGVSTSSISSWAQGTKAAPLWTVLACEGLKARRAIDNVQIYMVLVEQPDSGEMITKLLNTMKGVKCQRIR